MKYYRVRSTSHADHISTRTTVSHEDGSDLVNHEAKITRICLLGKGEPTITSRMVPGRLFHTDDQRDSFDAGYRLWPAQPEYSRDLEDFADDGWLAADCWHEMRKRPMHVDED